MGVIYKDFTLLSYRKEILSKKIREEKTAKYYADESATILDIFSCVAQGAISYGLKYFYCYSQ